MKIETTVNLKFDVYVKLENLSRSTGMSGSCIIMLLLSEMMKSDRYIKKKISRVKYQDRAPADEWRPTHVYLNEDMYEKLHDMRKNFKMSGSYIVAVAIKKYLHTITIEKMKQFTDNYCSQYIIIRKRQGPIFSYIVYWEYPDHHTLSKALE